MNIIVLKENLSMNGISSNLKEELKKSTQNKTRDKIKFISTILLTNILVALICLPSSETKVDLGPKPKTQLHPGHRPLILPLKLLLAFDQNIEALPVTIIAKDKKVLIKKAYLHTESLKDNHFKIEIPEDELAYVSSFFEEDMIAIPYVESKTTKVTPKGSKYEVNL